LAAFEGRFVLSPHKELFHLIAEIQARLNPIPYEAGEGASEEAWFPPLGCDVAKRATPGAPPWQSGHFLK